MSTIARWAKTLWLRRASQINNRQVLPTAMLAHIKANRRDAVAHNRAMRGVAIAIACVILVQSLLNARQYNDVHTQDRAALVTLLKSLEQIGKTAVADEGPSGSRPHSPLFVLWGGFFPLQHLSPWITAADLPDIEFLGLGWRTHSPPWNAILEARGIERLPPAIFQRDDVLLIADPTHYPALIDYVRDHYGLEGRLEPVGPELPWRWKIQVMRGRLHERP